MNQVSAALLAGGLATRLGDIAKDTPKAMLEVEGRPFIAWQLERLASQGVKKAVLCVGHLAGALKDFVGDGTRFGVQVAWSEDGERPLGTGGALKKALGLPSDPFYTLYADSWLEVDWAPLFERLKQSGAEAVMSVLHDRGALQPSNARFEQGWVKAYSKQAPGPDFEHTDYGLSLFTRRAFDRVEGQSFDLGELQGALAAAGTLAGVEVSRRFYEIGTPEGLREARELFKGRKSA